MKIFRENILQQLFVFILFSSIISCDNWEGKDIEKYNPNYGNQDDEPAFDKATGGKMKFKKDFEIK